MPRLGSPSKERPATPKRVWNGSVMLPGRSEKPPVSLSWKNQNYHNYISENPLLKSIVLRQSSVFPSLYSVLKTQKQVVYIFLLIIYVK